MYQLLTTNLGYNPDYIYYVAPSNWNSATHYYPLTKTNIQTAISAVAARTTSVDNILFYYNGHGTHDPWTIAPGVSPAELDSWLDTIDPCWLYGLPRHCQQMVIVLQSCYCGGFITTLTHHEAYPSGAVHRQRLVLTSTDSATESWEDMNGFGDPAWDPNGPNDDGNPNNPTNGNWDGSEFSSGLRMAFRDTDNNTFLEADDNPYMKKPGYNPDITAPAGNTNGKVSVKEAFQFAKYVECYSVYWQSYVQAQGWLLEYPQFWDPITAGDPQGIDPTTTYIFTHAPGKPSTPAGPANGTVGQTYTYSSSTTDLDGDQLSYLFDWGDGTNSGWVGPYNSGSTASAIHIWTAKGKYQIKVKAKDIHAVESIWSDSLPIKMPASSELPRVHFLDRILERFPHLFPVLRYILNH
jgi:hypothetical protein